MVRSFALIVCLGAMVGGCDQGGEAFNKSFNESFKTSCVTSATGGKVTTELATTFCDCVLGKIDGKYSAAEKVALSTDDIKPEMDACMGAMELPNG